MKWINKFINAKISGARIKELPFKPGSIVSIKHELFADPVISIVQETDERYMYMAYPNEFKGVGIKKGDNISCSIQSGNTEYVVSGRLNNINLLYPMYLHLCVEEMCIYEGKRDSKRYLVDYDASCVDIYTNESVSMTVKNISATGLCADVLKKYSNTFDGNNKISVKLTADNNETVFFNARILRIQQGERYNRLGMKIIQIDEINRIKYDKIINKLEDELGSLVISYIMCGSIN